MQYITRSIFWMAFSAAMGVLIAFTIWSKLIKALNMLWQQYVERPEDED